MHDRDVMSRRLPPLSALRAFEAAARHLSFTRAAAELGVTQAAISHQVKLLEDQLGQPLFRRLTRRLLLTDAGQTLWPGVRDGFDRLAQAVQKVQASRDGGVLTLSLTVSFAARWLVPRLGGFLKAHPEIDVKLTTTDRMVDFAREDVDAAIRHGAGQWAGLESWRVLSPAYTALLNPRLVEEAKLEQPSDLQRLPLLVESDDNVSWRAWFQAAGCASQPHRRMIEFDTTQMAVQAAIEGLGVALGPPEYFYDELESGRLIQPFEVYIMTDEAFFLVSPSGRAEEPKIRAFRDWVLAEAKKSEAEKTNAPRTRSRARGAA
jgi:LysR family glycine cleavage system transcriptional activator